MRSLAALLAKARGDVAVDARGAHLKPKASTAKFKPLNAGDPIVLVPVVQMMQAI